MGPGHGPPSAGRPETGYPQSSFVCVCVCVCACVRVRVSSFDFFYGTDVSSHTGIHRVSKTRDLNGCGQYVFFFQIPFLTVHTKAATP